MVTTEAATAIAIAMVPITYYAILTYYSTYVYCICTYRYYGNTLLNYST